MAEISADTDLASMTVAELRKALKAKGLTTTGVKQDLIDRLQLALATETEETDPNNDNDLLEDANELLGDDDDDDVEAVAEPPKKKEVTAPAPAAAKKVAINRVTAVDKPAATADGSKAEAAVSEGSVTTAPKMTDAERAAARAARFGATLDVASETKKQSRAERFGLKANNSSAEKIGGAPSVDLETLKKRAERFGQSSSTVIKKAEMDEKIRKRQERFGEVQPETKKAKKSEILSTIELNKTLKAPKVVTDEKLLKRAEKFGITPAN